MAETLEWLTKTETLMKHEHKAELKQDKELYPKLLACCFLPGAPMRIRAARCAAGYLNVVGTAELSNTITKCTDSIKGKDDPATLHTKLGAIELVGAVALTLGRALTLFIADIIRELVKVFKSQEVRIRIAVFQTFTSILNGLGSGVLNHCKDMYKCIGKGLQDKNMNIRVCSVSCAMALVSNCNWLQINELESCCAVTMKSLEHSTYRLRRVVAPFLGKLFSSSLDNETWTGAKTSKRPSEDDINQLILSGFIKGGSDNQATRAVRIGLTETILEYYKCLGAPWVERNIKNVLNTLFGILSQPKITGGSPIEGLCARNCALYIIVRVLGRNQGEKGRTATVQELSALVQKLLELPPGSKEGAQNDLVLTCSLEALAELTVIIGSPVSLIYDQLMQPLLAAALHSNMDVRLAAACGLRNLGDVVPNKASFLANQCLDRIKKYRTSPDAIHGIGYALSAVIGGSASSSLGLPHELAANVLALGDSLVHLTASDKQSHAVTLAAIETGWALIGSITSLGSAAVDPHISRISGLWCAMFPENAKPIKTKDMIAWTQILEGRCGALSSMAGFLQDCKELATVDRVKNITKCLFTAVTQMADIPSPKANSPLVPIIKKMRARIYAILLLIPVTLYEEIFSALLPHLVADFTLVDGSTNTCSLLRSLCHEDDGILLGESSEEKDESFIEDMLEDISGLRTIGNDPSQLWRPGKTNIRQLPAHVEVVDNSILLFGTIFPCLGSMKHRHQLLEHFTTCIKSTKAGPKRQAVQINIFSAFLSALKNTVERKGKLGKERVVATAQTLVLDALANSDLTLRCAAGEALGRLGQATRGKFVTDIIELLIERIKKDGSVEARTGFSLALGCLHRYVGGMGSSSKQLTDTVGILEALAKDGNPNIRVSALHALRLTVDAAGYEFSRYLDSTMKYVQGTVLMSSDEDSKVQYCAGKLLNTMISIIGPELQMDKARLQLILLICGELQEHADYQVRLAGLHGIQQLIMFAGKQVNLPTFIPLLQATLSSPNLQLRAAAAACLRQISQREAALVAQHGNELDQRLFKAVDQEYEPRVLKDLKEALRTLLSELAHTNPQHWLILCNNVLSGATEEEEVEEAPEDDPENDEDDEENDEEMGGKVQMKAVTRVVLPTRWQTKVFAVECVRDVIRVCAAQGPIKENPHFHLEASKKNAENFLVTKLSELIRTTFLAATSPVNELRKVGLTALEDIISYFADSIDIEIGGNHSLLEQYQAQVTSAMRPAFDATTPPDVTAIACKVIASWVCSGVNRNTGDLKRVLNLLVDRLEAVKSAPDPAYNERATTMLRIALLTSWAKIAIAAREKNSFAYLEEIVKPHETSLSKHWLDALRDYALMSLPDEYQGQVPESGAFYYPGTIVAALSYYEDALPILLHAVALYADFGDDASHNSDFYLVLGICTRALCGRASKEIALASLAALKQVVSASKRLAEDASLFCELCSVLNHTLITQSADAKVSVMAVLLSAVTGENPIREGKDATADSPINAAMVLATSLLMRDVPGLSPVGTPKKRMNKALPKETTHISYAMQVLANLPGLCSPQTVVDVAQIALLMALNLMKVGDDTLASQGVKCLNVILNSICTDENKNACKSLVLGSLEACLNALEMDSCKNRKSLHLALAVILACLSKAKLSDEKYQTRVGSIVKNSLVDTDKEIQIKAIQVLSTIIKLPIASQMYYLREVVPHAIILLSNATKNKPVESEEVEILKEVVNLLVTVVGQAEADHRLSLLAMAVSIFVGLLEDAPSTCGPIRKELHQCALAQLQKVGPLYPQEFKAVVTESPVLAQAMTNALKQDAQQKAGPAAGTMSAAQPTSANAKPAIQLKMDFSAFG
eukprot:m.98322 g.98322  ORF g.98322 m.98322 type:complete len:1851 (+) comp13631_c1_seq1:176-5728(+)